MKVLGSYINGNYKVTILDDGTKIRDSGKCDAFIPEKPESMDIKITNMCDIGCPFCHEDSKPDGKHADLDNIKFLDTLLPYTELAIGGGNPLAHPDLDKFLVNCKERKLICNMTVNQKHFVQDINRIRQLITDKLIYGIGISLTNPTDKVLNMISEFPNAVIHLINGVHKPDVYKKLYDRNLKVLILGFKDFRRGVAYHETHTNLEPMHTEMYDDLPEMLKHMSVVSFDNLALKQLDCKRLLSPEDWEEFYMGDDGGYTMYIDLVNKTYSASSITPASERKPITDDIATMFADIRPGRAI